MCTFSHFVIFQKLVCIYIYMYIYYIYILTKTAYLKKDSYFMVRSISII